MSRQDFNLQTTSEITNVRAPGSFQAIDATYYNITDLDGNPIAGLLVMLDRFRHPVRAELHLYENLEPYLRENAVRRAQALLQDRYYSRQPVKLRILQTYQERTSMDVALDASAAETGRDDGARRRWPLLLIGLFLALILLTGLWGVWRLLRGENAVEPTPAVTTLEGDAAGEAPAPAAAAAADAAAQTNDLPKSRNAREDLAIGMRVRMRSGLQSFLLSEPNVNSGQSIGVLDDTQAATIIDGPIWREGTSDTIVWWYVRLDDGRQGWAPANTSELTLLEPVP